jgi:hypothetical protein
MAQPDFSDALNDSIDRLANGQSIEDCLNAWPGFAARLRPLLETGQDINALQLRADALVNERDLVWEMVQDRLDIPPTPGFPRWMTTLLLVGLIGGALVLGIGIGRAGLPSSLPFLVGATLTPTFTATFSPTPTHTHTATWTPTFTMTSTEAITATWTASPTATETNTASPTPTFTATRTSTLTPTVTASPTSTPPPTNMSPSPTPTFAPGCGPPLSAEDAQSLVLEIYPNTTITSVEELTKFGDVLVWEIDTSHGIRLDIDVACGFILVIENVPAAEATPEPANIPGVGNDIGSVGSGSSGGTDNSDGGGNDNDDDDDDSADDNDDDD